VHSELPQASQLLKFAKSNKNLALHPSLISRFRIFQGEDKSQKLEFPDRLGYFPDFRHLTEMKFRENFSDKPGDRFKGFISSVK